MGFIEAFQVAAPGDIAKRPALVYQPIVNDKVDRAIGGHARADPLQRPHTGGAQRDQADGEKRKHHGIQIVQLEPAGARPVVRAVPAPSPAMHDVLVGQRREKLHTSHRQQDD